MGQAKHRIDAGTKGARQMQSRQQKSLAEGALQNEITSGQSLAKSKPPGGQWFKRKVSKAEQEAYNQEQRIKAQEKNMVKSQYSRHKL